MVQLDNNIICPECAHAKFWSLRRGSYKCRKCGTEFRINSDWGKTKLHDEQWVELAKGLICDQSLSQNMERSKSSKKKSLCALDEIQQAIYRHLYSKEYSFELYSNDFFITILLKTPSQQHNYLVVMRTLSDSEGVLSYKLIILDAKFIKPIFQKKPKLITASHTNIGSQTVVIKFYTAEDPYDEDVYNVSAEEIRENMSSETEIVNFLTKRLANNNSRNNKNFHLRISDAVWLYSKRTRTIGEKIKALKQLVSNTRE